MKTKNFLNIAAFALVIIGVLFKANHWPGANVSIILSGVMMLVPLFLFAVKENKEVGLTDGLNYFLTGTLGLFIIGIEFKLMHWPGAGIFVVVCYFLAFLIPVILMVNRSEIKIARQFMVTFFTYFILLVALFPKNPVTEFFKGGAIMNSEASASRDSALTDR